MKARLLFIIIFLSICSSASGNPFMKIYGVDDPILHKLHDLAIQEGYLPPSSTGPISGYEMYYVVENILQHDTVEHNSSTIQLMKTAIETPMETRNAIFPVNGYVILQPTFSFNTTSLTYRDWVIGPNEREDFLALTGEAIIGDNTYGIFTYHLNQRFSQMFSEELPRKGGLDSNFFLGSDFKEKNRENTFPHTAFLGLGTPNITFLAGRTTISWGLGVSGNLFVNGHAPYHDFMQFSAHTNRLKFISLALFLNPIQAAIDGENTTAGTWDGVRYDYSTGNDIFMDRYTRIFRGNRLELTLLPRVRLGITEGSLFYSDNVDLRMFSPLMFLHNYLDFYESNHFFMVDAEIIIHEGWLGYLQLLLDQFQTAAEQESASQELPPSAYGILAGVQFNLPTSVEGAFKGYCEFVYTSPALYLRNHDNGDTNLDIVQLTQNRDGGLGGLSFIGHPIGPDSILANVRIGYDTGKQVYVFVESIFSAQGERGLYIDGKIQEVPYDLGLNPISPTGTPEYTFIFGVGTDYRLPQYNLTFSGKAHTINKWNNRNNVGEEFFDIQLHVGFTYHLNIL